MLVVTRHEALVEYLREQGLLKGEVRVQAHVSLDDVRGQDVIGVLPLHLAALAATVTEVPLRDLPLDARGRELTLEEVRKYAGPAVTYVVTAKSDDYVTG